MTSFNTELQYFSKHKKEFLAKYKNQFLLIKGENLIGNYPTEKEAYKVGLETFGNKPFLIKQVLEKEENISFSALYFGLRDGGL